MKKFRNITVSILAVMLMTVFVLPFSVCANGLPPSPELIVELSNLPEGTVYVDIAIRAPEDRIVDLAQDPPEGVSKDSPMVRGEYGEFVSYSFRVRYAESTIVPDAHSNVSFSDPEIINDSKQVRLVMADKDGNILKVSDPFTVTPKNLFDYSLNLFEYDAATDALHVSMGYSSMFFLLYIGISIIGLIATCMIEWLIGVAFKLTRNYAVLIVGTNVVSQTLMRLLFIPLYSMMPHYIALTVLLEILVYTGEFIAYRFLAKDVPARKWLLYVITANTASLLASILLNIYL